MSDKPTQGRISQIAQDRATLGPEAPTNLNVDNCAWFSARTADTIPNTNIPCDYPDDAHWRAWYAAYKGAVRDE